MSLWGNDINTVDVGDTVEVTNGYVNEFRGTPQLASGKFGKVTVIEKGSGGGSSGEEEFPAEDAAEESED